MPASPSATVFAWIRPPLAVISETRKIMSPAAPLPLVELLRMLLYSNADLAATFFSWFSADGSSDVAAYPLQTHSKSLIEGIQPDLVLLEPPPDSELLLQECEGVRQTTDRPMVVLSSLDDELTITRALSSGADDYLVLPVRENELVARVRAMARRLRNDSAEALSTEFGGIVLSTEDLSAEVRGRKVFLSPIEFRLLSCLVTARGKVLTHDYLMSRVWGPEYVDSREYLHL
ncbi:MAG: response regulator transcription factor, partial [Chloroflexi bacterium]|nr:response regulator transcription factor [Chloroflexota bacterium]